LYLATQKDKKKPKRTFPTFASFWGFNSTTTSPGLQRLLERDGFDSLQQVGVRRAKSTTTGESGYFWDSKISILDFLIMFFLQIFHHDRLLFFLGVTSNYQPWKMMG
jgi:hypothetical protein